MLLSSLLSPLLLALGIAALPNPNPLRVKIKDPYADKKNLRYLTTAQTKVNEIIIKMEAVVHHPDAPYNQHILKTCFGEKYHNQITQIQQAVDTLVKGDVLIDKTLSRVFETTAVYYHQTKTIWLFKEFYEQGVVGSALALIHEATHALLHTEDVFTKDGHFTPVKMLPHTVPKGYVAYIDQDFKTLRSVAPARTMVQNADSYRLLGHLALSGFRDLGHDYPMTDWVLEGVPIPEKPEEPKPKKKGWLWR